MNFVSPKFVDFLFDVKFSSRIIEWLQRHIGANSAAGVLPFYSLTDHLKDSGNLTKGF